MWEWLAAKEIFLGYVVHFRIHFKFGEQVYDTLVGVYDTIERNIVFGKWFDQVCFYEIRLSLRVGVEGNWPEQSFFFFVWQATTTIF